ncbi:AI-2E family transporter [Kamptonema cortianum]|nr:AI-2E family transporter [Kamptonema cortianum]
MQNLTTRLAEESSEDNPFVRWNPAVLAKPPGPLGAIDQALLTYRPTLEQFGLPTTRRAFTSQFVDPRREQISQGLQGFVNGTVSIIGAATSQVILLCFTPLFVIFLMMDLASFRSRYAYWIPPAIRKDVTTMISEVGDVFQRYVRGMTINISIFTAVQAVILTMMGAPYSYLFAIMAGALSLIPNIGGILTVTTMVLVTGFSGVEGNWMYTAPNSWVFGLVLAAVFTVLSTIWDVLVTPRVVGKAVNLHPFVGMFVVFCGGALFGLLGMMLAYPVAGVVKLVLEKVLRVTNTPVTSKLGLPAVPLRHRGEPTI